MSGVFFSDIDLLGAWASMGCVFYLGCFDGVFGACRMLVIFSQDELTLGADDFDAVASIDGALYWMRDGHLGLQWHCPAGLACRPVCFKHFILPLLREDVFLLFRYFLETSSMEDL